MKKQRLTALCLACLQSGKPDQEKLAGHNSIYKIYCNMLNLHAFVGG
ncbi:hypothetical protein [Escherichia coli]